MNKITQCKWKTRTSICSGKLVCYVSTLLLYWLTRHHVTLLLRRHRPIPICSETWLSVGTVYNLLDALLLVGHVGSLIARQPFLFIAQRFHFWLF